MFHIETFPCVKAGIVEYDFDHLRLGPMTFADLLSFTRMYSAHLPEIRKMTAFWNYMITKDPNVEKLLYIDAAYVTDMLIFASITELEEVTFNYQCYKCGSDESAKIGVLDISYNVREVPVKIKIGRRSYTFSYLSVRDIMRNLRYLVGNRYTDAYDVLLFIAQLKEYSDAPSRVEAEIFSSEHSYAAIMQAVEYFIHPYQPIARLCNACGTENPIVPSRLFATDFFRLLFLNGEPAKIQVSAK